MIVLDVLQVSGLIMVPMVAFMTLLYRMFAEQKQRIVENSENTKIIKEEVKNSHDINLRDNMDDNHSEVIEMFKMINNRFENVDKEQVRMHARIQRLEKGRYNHNG